MGLQTLHACIVLQASGALLVQLVLAVELGAGMDPLVDDGTRPTDDGDGDGVGLLDELINGSSDDNFDSDGDGLTDYFEIFVNSSDPGAVTNVASGDLNDNGEIDVGDMLLLQKMLLDPTQ